MDSEARANHVDIQTGCGDRIGNRPTSLMTPMTPRLDRLELWVGGGVSLDGQGGAE